MLLPRLSKCMPPPRTATAQWCEQNVYLSPRVPTSVHGQWRGANVASHCRPGGLFDCLDDAEVETVAVMKGSQTALTLSVKCWLAKQLVTDPGPVLTVMNSAVDAREKSGETWRPLWEDSVPLQGYLPTNRRREWTKLYQLINHHPVYWVGANSAGRLGSKSIRYLDLDEVDKYPERFGAGKKGQAREAGALALAKQRTKGYRKTGLAKIIVYSTPTTETGPIYTDYMAGDQRKLHVRCPHCQADQVMVWRSFKIDMELAKTNAPAAVSGAHYECPHCKQPWTDDDRYQAIDGGTWKPTATPQDPKCRSLHHPSWCSKFVTCSYLAAQWIKAQESQSALQDFVNSECGEPFVAIENRIRDAVFLELEGEYKEGECFADAEVYAQQYEGKQRTVLMGVDVQKGYFVPVVRQFVEGGDSGLVWCGDVPNLEAVDALAARLGVQYVFMDQRYRTREVQEWAANHAGYIPCYGTSRRSRALYSSNAFNVDEGRREQRAGRVIEVIEFDPDMLKDILAVQIQRAAGSRRWMVPRGYAMHSKYCEQMTAERCINGRWVNPQQRPNHFWDAEGLALLAAIRLGWWGNAYEGTGRNPDTAEGG